MRAIGVVPVRMAATRFPGKPMARLHGMPMLEHCYHRARLARGLSAAYVATCDDEIAEHMRSFGGNVVMTATTHKRATTRTAEALQHVERNTGERVDVVVMVQGDEPLISPNAIAETLRHFVDPGVQIVNVMALLRSYDQFVDKNNVKVVVNGQGDAMYFSREPIPSPWRGAEGVPMYMQTGIIAFRRDALLRFNQLPETPLERIESVDMNRVLESGGRVRMVLTEDVTIGVDTPEELEAAERLLSGDPALAEYLIR